MWHFAIPATLYDHPPKRSHQVAVPIDHSVCVAHCLPLPHCSPFYFCALLLSSYSISILFHILFPILSVFHVLPLSLFCNLLLVAMHSVPYAVTPPLQSHTTLPPLIYLLLRFLYLKMPWRTIAIALVPWKGSLVHNTNPLMISTIGW